MNKKKIIAALAAAIAGTALVAGITIEVLNLTHSKDTQNLEVAETTTITNATEATEATEEITNEVDAEVTTNVDEDNASNSSNTSNDIEVPETEEVIELSEEYLVDYPFNNNIYVKLALGTSFNPENATGLVGSMTNLDKYENGVIFVDIDNSEGYYTYSYNSVVDANYYVAWGETEDVLTYEIINVEECENGFTISTVRETIEETEYTQASVSNIYILEYKIDESNKITLQLTDSTQSSEYLDFYRTTENPVVVVK